MRRMILLIVLLSIAFVIGFAVWRIASAVGRQWMRMKTQAEFGVIFMSCGQHIESHPDDGPFETRKGLLQIYHRRTGRRMPLDSWGREIVVNLSKEGDQFTLEVQSAGGDGVLSTSDDMDYTFRFLGGPLTTAPTSGPSATIDDRNGCYKN